MSRAVARGLSSTCRLNDGVEMPCFGLGAGPGATTATEETINSAFIATKSALDHGYRLVDTATVYKTEENVGKGLVSSGKPRKDLFVVSKLWMDKHGAELATTSFHESLKRLGMDYVDLFMIHCPRGGKLIETYAALHKLKEQGLIRSVGVSNFGVHHLEGLKNAGLPTPSVNQIELHPYQSVRKAPIVEYCQEHGIAVMGYSPMIRQQKNEDPILVEMAKKFKKSVPQILIRWSIDRGFITIPKSGSPERIAHNADVFDFSLNSEDMDVLNKMPEHSCTWDPTQEAWVD